MTTDAVRSGDFTRRQTIVTTTNPDGLASSSSHTTLASWMFAVLASLPSPWRRECWLRRLSVLLDCWPPNTWRISSSINAHSLNQPYLVPLAASSVVIVEIHETNARTTPRNLNDFPFDWLVPFDRPCPFDSHMFRVNPLWDRSVFTDLYIRQQLTREGSVDSPDVEVFGTVKVAFNWSVCRTGKQWPDCSCVLHGYDWPFDAGSEHWLELARETLVGDGLRGVTGRPCRQKQRAD